jgi:hypothetical protein
MSHRRVEDDGPREPCPECKGSGKFASGNCRHCDGTGEVPGKPLTKTQREEEISAAAEYGNRQGKVAAEAVKPDLISVAQSAAAVVMFCDIYTLLVEKQILTQGDAVARLEKVSNAVMVSGPDDLRAHAVTLIDIVRNALADEPKRESS